MSTETITYVGTLKAHQCPDCQIWHGIPTDLEQRMLNNRGPKGLSVCCPMGHRWHFTGKTEKERLEEQLKWARDDAARERSRRDQAQAEAKHQERRAAGMKGQLQRTKNRQAKGICPCCNRQFVNVERHMAGQHPGYADV